MKCVVYVMSAYNRIVDLVGVYFSQNPVQGEYVKQNFKPCCISGCLENHTHCVSLQHGDAHSPIWSNTHPNANKLILHGPRLCDDCSEILPKFEILTAGVFGNCVCSIETDEDVMQFLSSNFPVTLKTPNKRKNKLRNWSDMAVRLDMLLKEIQEQNSVNSIYDTLYPRICKQ